jgi:Cytotoxic
MGRKPIPKASFLNDCEYLGFVHGERRWRSRNRKRLYTWDALHGEVEAFSARGRHPGAFDPVTEALIKVPAQGRTIDV